MKLSVRAAVVGVSLALIGCLLVCLTAGRAEEARKSVWLDPLGIQAGGEAIGRLLVGQEPAARAELDGK